MNIFNVITMLGGLALFLYGMRIMGDGLKKESTGSFKKALEKVTGNPFMGFLVGAGLTALIQSATATIVIVSGLVGAGIMSLTQSIGVIFGANVGTTITGQIIRLLDVDASKGAWLNFFKPDTLAPIAAIIGILFLMFIKSKKSETMGTIAMGFGILFTGLITMTGAVSPLSESESFRSFFISFGDRPLLGFLAGFVVAFILQSSSATVGILQALSVTGALTFAAVYPILMGIYVGDCVTTAIVCSIGTTADAKRTGMVNILFNLGEILLVVLTVNILHGLGGLPVLWTKVLDSGGIANTHTVFKLVTALALLPFAKALGKLSTRIVKDDKKDPVPEEIAALDKNLFKSPALALNSSYKAMLRMKDIMVYNFDVAVGLYSKYDDNFASKLDDDENLMDSLDDAVNNYLAQLSPHLAPGLQESIQYYYLQCVTDLERAGDHIHEIRKSARTADADNIHFSEDAMKDLESVKAFVDEILELTSAAFEKQDLGAARDIQPYCETLSMLCDRARENHIARMKAGICDSSNGSAYLDLLMHIERVSDMCSNIGLHTIGRHSEGGAGFEHEYMENLRRGNDPDYNRTINNLQKKFGLE